jgi:hypothetical protein
MKASIGERAFRDSCSDDSVIQYLAASIIDSPEGPRFFSKLEVLSNPSLLFQIAQLLAERLQADVSLLCLLASSGMAIGVAVALISKLPLAFYRRSGWPQPESHGLGPRFRPGRLLGDKVALVDSHETTRFTSALCHDELLQSYDVKAVQVLVPCSFDSCLDDTFFRHMDYAFLMDFSSAVGEVAKGFSDGTTAQDLLEAVSDPRNRFWQYPPLQKPQNPYWEFDAPGIRERPHWFIGRGADCSVIKSPSPELEALCSRIEPDDEGIWEFFSSPGFVQEFALAAGDVINLSDYDHLIGVGHLGTAVAIAIAYYNQQSFKGSINFYLGRHGFIPRLPTLLRNKRVLPIEMRICTGVYPVDVFLRVRDLGGSITEYITVFPPENPRNLVLQSRQTSISRLIDHGVVFRSLAG